MTHRRWAAVAAVALLSVAGCGSDDEAGDAVATTTTAPAGIVREALGETAPANAPGQVLYLQRVTIPPGERLAEHFHQGTQLATVTSGVLTYNLVSGTVAITRAGGKKTSATGPSTVALRAGDSIVEPRDVVHYGANRSEESVVIELAALLETGAPMATPTG